MLAPKPEILRTPTEVLLVTGPPGAGRSALLGSLLAGLPPGARAAVCVHQFAKAFGLETTPLERAAHYSEVYDFGSGCVCCSPDGDLVRVLQGLAAAEPPPTHLLIETTGLADPESFVKVFARPEHAAEFRLRGVVTVLSALGLARGGADEDEEATRQRERRGAQLAVSDAVVLSKTDLLDGTASEEAQARAAEMVAAQCPPGAALSSPVCLPERGVGWAELEALLPAAPLAAAEAGDACAPDQPAVSWGGWGATAGTHDGSFCTAVSVEDGCVLWAEALSWLEGLLESGRI